MRSVTTAFRRALASGRRDYVSRATILLEDGTFMAVGVDSTLIAVNDTNALKILSINADTFFSGVGSTEPGVYEFTYTSSRWRYNGTETTSLTPYGITVSGTVASGDTITVYATVGYSNIWSNGISVDDAVSSDNVLEVGSAIVNKGTLVLNNIYDEFTPYDFSNAEVKMYVGLDDLDDGTDEEVLMKTVYVDDPGYNGSLITLSCLDNMSLFDKPYTESSLVYPATLKDVVLDACSKCGVTLANTSQYFPNYNFEVDAPDIKEGTTFRQVLSWASQIACCFARINSEGELEVRWYNTDAFLPGTETDLDGGQFDDGSPSYSSGDAADGGSFNPWNTGTAYDGGTFSTSKAYHVIPSSFSHQLSTDDVVITGVNVVIKTASDTSADAFYTFSYGEPGYVISIENNGFIDGSNGQAIANFIGGVLVGLTFRKASITHLSDPTIEAGDVAYYFDSKDVKYKILVSSTRFSIDGSQNTVSSAETPKKNSAVRYSESTRNYVELRKRMKKQQSDWQAAEEELSERIAAASGLYSTEVTDTSGTKTYYHDKAELDDSNIVMLFSTAGFTLTSNYQDPNPTWYGMTVDGNFIAGILQASGVNADWINSGAISISDTNHNETFYANTQTGVVRINANSFSLSGNTIDSIAKAVAAGYGTCTVAANTADKNVTLQGFSLYNGASVNVYFQYGNTASSPRLGVNGTGYKDIYCRGEAITAKDYWTAGSVSQFTYDGTNQRWVLISNSQQETFNHLTASNNSNDQGIYLQNGKLYLNFQYAVGQTLKLGGYNNTNGSLLIQNSNSVTFGHIGFVGPYSDQYGLVVTKYQQGVYNSYVDINSDGHIYFGKTNQPIDSFLSGSVSADIKYMETPHTDSKDIASWEYTDYPDSLMIKCDSTIIMALSGGGVDGRRVGIQVTPYHVNLNGYIYINGQLLATSGKGRLVKDTSYGDRILYCYETPTPYFGDIGTAKTDENGEAFISIDDIFDETVNTNVEYSVFLQKEGPGDLWVDEKEHSYFIVKGTPNLKFSWELKAVQKGFETYRLDDDALRRDGEMPVDDVEALFDDELAEFDREMEELGA